MDRENLEGHKNYSEFSPISYSTYRVKYEIAYHMFKALEDVFVINNTGKKIALKI